MLFLPPVPPLDEPPAATNVDGLKRGILRTAVNGRLQVELNEGSRIGVCRSCTQPLVLRSTVDGALRRRLTSDYVKVALSASHRVARHTEVYVVSRNASRWKKRSVDGPYRHFAALLHVEVKNVRTRPCG
ncbi:unnamed protein product [Rangifer tarandus platyrhynchus]|uniref:Uncharacterized protein n=1 Tax=Rangifer tarandus platyrhynchus TaxID=3082113 RepID=A0ABN8XLL4_RANTA|nr:unnamed protein product [Rangifer tarandus platyrhynchus]